MKTCFVITAIFVITCKAGGLNIDWPKGWPQKLPKSTVIPKEPIKSSSWPSLPSWPKVAPTTKSPASLQESAKSPNGSRRRCQPFRSCLNNYDCGQNGICIGSFGSGYV